MERFNPNLNEGLSSKQVKLRIEQGLTNKETSVPTKTIPRIIRDNIFTLFNFLNFGLALAIFAVGSYKNLLFMGIVFCNTLISTVQEIRSKLVIDKLSVITSTKTKVIRDGKIVTIDNEDIVLDDIILFKSGNQIVTDAIIMEGEVSVNESFITGETELITYKEGDMLKSGSFIVVGNCKAKVEHVSLDNYTNVISKDAKYVKPINSILMNSLNKIIKVISILIIPLGLLLFLNQYNLDKNLELAVINTVAALIGMIPEGLVLLTSTVLAVSVIRLARLNVLVQELYCIEMLARVDTICLDKTGTITDGKMEVIKVINLNKKYNLEEVMGNIVNNLEVDNATSEAISNYFKKYDNYEVIKKIPFSPIYKYSGVEFKEGKFVFGAPEFLTKKEIKEVKENQDNRTLLICFNDEPIGVIVLKDTIRKNAKKTLDYLAKEGVDIKIISGDSVKTVSKIARDAGLTDIRSIDVSSLNNLELENAILENNIFARVTPLQKKQMVEILQKNKHFVAMTGDGVNDVLALKQADCSITIKNATDAARNVSQLVLLDDDFDSIPSIVREGRRTINNIERSATLFLAKTGYAFFLAVIFMFVNFNYPFQPIQLTLTNFFTIGVPSFILALEPNNNRIKGNFLINVFSRSLPTSLTIVLNIVIIAVLGNFFLLNDVQISTLCVIMTGFTGFLLLFKICFPLNRLRLSLIIILILGFIGTLIGFREFFALTVLNLKMFIFILILVFISLTIFSIMSILVDKLIKKYPRFFN